MELPLQSWLRDQCWTPYPGRSCRTSLCMGLGRDPLGPCAHHFLWCSKEPGHAAPHSSSCTSPFWPPLSTARSPMHITHPSTYTLIVILTAHVVGDEAHAIHCFLQPTAATSCRRCCLPLSLSIAVQPLSLGSSRVGIAGAAAGTSLDEESGGGSAFLGVAALAQALACAALPRLLHEEQRWELVEEEGADPGRHGVRGG